MENESYSTASYIAILKLQGGRECRSLRFKSEALAQEWINDQVKRRGNYPNKIKKTKILGSFKSAQVEVK